MISIEEYISRRKKEDKLNEFDLNARTQNIRQCVDYVFEYFTNCLDITALEEKTVLHDEKLEKYRHQLQDYEPEIREWAVSIYNDYGNQMHKLIGNIVKEDELFFLYDTDSEFRNASYNCYSKLIKKCSFIKDQTEMLFRLIKDYHRVQSQREFDFRKPLICYEINDWVSDTWEKHQVNLFAFSSDWITRFDNNQDVWPSTHKKKSNNSWSPYDYDYKQKSNLFNIDSLYRKMPKKSFIKGRKQEFEALFMYYWVHGSDDEYWQEYLGAVLPALKKE